MYLAGGGYLGKLRRAGLAVYVSKGIGYSSWGPAYGISLEGRRQLKEEQS